jgi:hypothetical protein
MNMKRHIIILMLLACAGLLALLTWLKPDRAVSALPEREPALPGATAISALTETPPLATAAISSESGLPVERESASESAVKLTFRFLAVDGSDALQDPNMDMISGNVPSAYMVARAKAIAELDDQLSPTSVNVLYKLMAKTAGEDPLGTESLNVIKNEAACKLRQQKPLPAYYANNLAAMFLDSRYDETWREYCIQYMGRAYSMVTADEKNLIASVLWRATANDQDRLAGTALVALKLNAGNELIETKRVMELSRSWAMSDHVNPGLRTAAIQISAELGDTHTLPIAVRLAEETATPINLRLSAIAAIGRLGDQGNLARLEKYLMEDNPVITVAAKAAIRNLQIL